MKLAVLALLLPSAWAAVKKTAANAVEVKFLEEYAKGEGTFTTESGLMYRVLADGAGGSPELGTPCSCHYEGRTATNYPAGKTFDSSYARGQPTTFAPKQVISAWTEAMQKMRVGAKWELVCPPEMSVE